MNDSWRRTLFSKISFLSLSSFLSEPFLIELGIDLGLGGTGAGQTGVQKRAFFNHGIFKRLEPILNQIWTVLTLCLFFFWHLGIHIIYHWV